MKKERQELQAMQSRHPRGRSNNQDGFEQAQGSLTMVDQTQRYVLVAEDNQMISYLLQETLKSM